MTGRRIPQTDALRERAVGRDTVVPVQPPSGTVSFLFTDVEGSTRLWQEHPDTMQGAMARHDEIVRGAIEAHHGHVVKTTGDGFHAAFATARDALLGAVDAMRAIEKEAWDEVGPLRVRMGLHTGEATQRDGDYYGPSLNRAARLMSAANGGQLVCSQTTAELVARRPRRRDRPRRPRRAPSP